MNSHQPFDPQSSFLRLLKDQGTCHSVAEQSQEEWGEFVVIEREEGGLLYCLIVDNPVLSDIADYLERVQDSDILFVALGPTSRTNALLRKVKWQKLMTRLQSTGFTVAETFALYPTPWKPHIIFDLQKEILNYVEITSHRGSNGIAKHAIKKGIVQIFGSGTWEGWIVASMNKTGKQKVLGTVQNRYIFLTSDRQIALVFKDKKRVPGHVEKSGPVNSLKKEWESHQWARKKLADAVPELYDFTVSGSSASLKMEYVPEKNPINIAAQALQQKKAFESEALAGLDFLHFVFTCMTGTGIIEKKSMPESIVKTVQQGLDYLLQLDINTDAVDRLHSSLKEMPFPLIPQHGDFCVRNILYRNPNIKVLIDWEDFHHSMLPLVDMNMLTVSLAESWDGLNDKKGIPLFALPSVAEKYSELQAKMNRQLKMTDEEWLTCSLLSLSYLVGNNLFKGRQSTAASFVEEFHSQVSRLTVG